VGYDQSEKTAVYSPQKCFFLFKNGIVWLLQIVICTMFTAIYNFAKFVRFHS